MSITYYLDIELNGLWRELTRRGADAKDALLTLTVLGLANRAAYSLQYGEHDIRLPEIESAESAERVPDWTIEQWAQNLLYNCVTSGGTNFAPCDHVERLLQWAGVKPNPGPASSTDSNVRLEENLVEISENIFSNRETAASFYKASGEDSVGMRAYIREIAHAFTKAESELIAQGCIWDGGWIEAIEMLVSCLLNEEKSQSEIEALCLGIASRFMLSPATEVK